MVQSLRIKANNLFTTNDPLASFDMLAIAKSHPVIIARTLLYLAISIQQIPPQFDSSSLSLDLDEALHDYTGAVFSLIVHDDELIGTLEGLECLLFQAIFHINAGNLKRAWLTFRKGLSMCQLMGLHRCTENMTMDAPSKSRTGGRYLWLQFVFGDRYSGTILGMPPGSSDDSFGPQERIETQSESINEFFARKVGVIAGRISDRNRKESSHMFAITQGIEHSMDSLKRELSQSWWQIPDFTSMERSVSKSILFTQIMQQIWFFQLETLLHLPFMLRAAKDHRYEHNKLSCLQASRGLINRYLALRGVNSTQMSCRIVDFGAFTSTVMLVLDLITPPQTSESDGIKQQRESDRLLVNQVLAIMEVLARYSRETVAAQSATVIKALLATIDGSRLLSGDLILKIPHLGTIRIERPSGSIRPNSEEPIATQGQSVYAHDPTTGTWDGMHATNFGASAVSFTSSMFPDIGKDPLPQDFDWLEDGSMFNEFQNPDVSGLWML